MEAYMYNFEALFQHLAGEALKFFSLRGRCRSRDTNHLSCECESCHFSTSLLSSSCFISNRLHSYNAVLSSDVVCMLPWMMYLSYVRLLVLQDRRTHIVVEIYDTERSYVESLQTLVMVSMLLWCKTRMLESKTLELNVILALDGIEQSACWMGAQCSTVIRFVQGGMI